MPRMVIDGCGVEYRIYGDEGVPVILTPGGRQGRDAFRPLAREMVAKGCQVILWDRPNTGESDLYLGRERSEQEYWADVVAELARRLEVAPAYFGGGSAGCRNALMVAVRHPEVVRGLVLFMATGGPYACQNLGYQYHVPFIHAAQAGGMAAVAETPHFAAVIEKNPAARDQLLAKDPQEFIGTMRAWDETFYYSADHPVIGCSEAELRAIRVPTLLVHGNDDHHSRGTSDRVASLLPNVVTAECPWGYQEYIDVANGKVPGQTPARALLTRLAEPFTAFVAKTEARLQAVPAR